MRYRKRSVHQDEDEYQNTIGDNIRWVILIICLIGLGIGSNYMNNYMDNIKQEKRIKRYTLETEAYCTQIKEEKQKTQHEWTTLYYPVFRYKVNGNTYEGPADTATGKNQYGRGKYYQIYVDPDNPSEFVISRYQESSSKSKRDFLFINPVLVLILIVNLISIIRKKCRQNKTSDHCGTDDEYDDYR